MPYCASRSVIGTPRAAANQFSTRCDCAVTSGPMPSPPTTAILTMIADYNVGHSREVTGKGVNADINYLFSLGPQALPGINKSPRLREGDWTLVASRDSLVDRFQRETVSWRAWSLRDWRLKQYLHEQGKRTAG